MFIFLLAIKKRNVSGLESLTNISLRKSIKLNEKKKTPAHAEHKFVVSIAPRGYFD